MLGLSIGLAAGISPGPLLVLVITSALRSGWRAGALAACAPLVSDALVVLTALVVLDHLPHRALGVLGVVGAAFVIWTGVLTVRQSRREGPAVDAASDQGSTIATVRQAVVVNLLSPHPWVAWTTALGPLVVTTWRSVPRDAALLVVGFYVALVGIKVVVAVLVASGRHRLSGVGFQRALGGAGGLLVLAGIALGVEFAPSLA